MGNSSGQVSVLPPRVTIGVLAALVTVGCLRAQNGSEPQPAQDSDAKTVSSDRTTGAHLFAATADLESPSHTQGATLAVVQGNKQTSRRHGEFAVAPLPLLNPSIGNGMGGVVMYTLRLDSSTSTLPSTFALCGFGTGTGSWGLGVGARLYLKKDLYRVLTGYGGGAFNYNFFGIGPEAGSAGVAIPLSQSSQAYLIQVTRRVVGKWYFGPRYHHLTNDVELNTDKLKHSNTGGQSSIASSLAVPLPSNLNLTTAALGVSIQRDTSDSPFYPRTGSILTVTLDFFDKAFGAQFSYQNFLIEYNKYISLGKKNVMAIHGSACAATNGAPFFDLCLLGNSKDLRGYQIGQYRDNRMLDTQAEFRREVFWRIGVVAFVGVGEVARTFGDFNGSSLVPGGGVGLRCTIAKVNHINLRADYAWGDNSRAFYMSVGEAF